MMFLLQLHGVFPFNRIGIGMVPFFFSLLGMTLKRAAGELGGDGDGAVVGTGQGGF